MALQAAGARCFSVSRTGMDQDTGQMLPPEVSFVTDLTDDGAAKRAIDAAEQVIGPLDVLINSAGISEVARAEATSGELLFSQLAINLAAVQELSAEFVCRCKARKRGGAIINISSILSGMPMRGSSGYAASKAALDQMSRVHALEWGRHGIRVNVIAPGWFPTPMTDGLLSGPTGAVLRQKNPLGRLGEAGDIAGAVLLLASDAGRYMTGSVIVVDGGQSLAG
ncbi:MAG: SDR family oxidoreductase [Rhizobiaceae bacterium]|nr:SDR family oxidoreductase [Rhizobiaceae bacterium]